MITATCEMPPYRTPFTDGTRTAIADTSSVSGAKGDGFRPHDLLEAALATCVNMTVRIYAESHGIPLRSVTTRVMLARHPDETVFRYDLDDFTPEQREKLIYASNACPVKRSLALPIRFERGPTPPQPPV